MNKGGFLRCYFLFSFFSCLAIQSQYQGFNLSEAEENVVFVFFFYSPGTLLKRGLGILS